MIGDAILIPPDLILRFDSDRGGLNRQRVRTLFSGAQRHRVATLCKLSDDIIIFERLLVEALMLVLETALLLRSVVNRPHDLHVLRVPQLL